jgi:uncharacterized sporulation protein YeaH/YhbH (DUF444 family)
MRAKKAARQIGKCKPGKGDESDDKGEGNGKGDNNRKDVECKGKGKGDAKCDGKGNNGNDGEGYGDPNGKGEVTPQLKKRYNKLEKLQKLRRKRTAELVEIRLANEAMTRMGTGSVLGWECDIDTLTIQTERDRLSVALAYYRCNCDVVGAMIALLGA